MNTDKAPSLGEQNEGAQKLEELLRKLDSLPLAEKTALCTFDLSPHGQERAVLLCERDRGPSLAQWRRHGTKLIFERVPGGADRFETESVDVAFDHTREFIKEELRNRAQTGKKT
jgi:hypothetical protein